MICKVKTNLNNLKLEDKMFFDFIKNTNKKDNDFLLINLWKNQSKKIDIIFEIHDFLKNDNTLDIAQNLEFNYNRHGNVNVIVQFLGDKLNRVYKNGIRIK